MRCVGGILGDSSAVADISVQNVCETLFDPCQQVDWCAVSCISETDLGWSGGGRSGARVQLLPWAISFVSPYHTRPIEEVGDGTSWWQRKSWVLLSAGPGAALVHPR